MSSSDGGRRIGGNHAGDSGVARVVVGAAALRVVLAEALLAPEDRRPGEEVRHLHQRGDGALLLGQVVERGDGGGDCR